MSFLDSARTFALKQAEAFEQEARRVGILRSVDATQASGWLAGIAKDLRDSCNGKETRPRAEQADDAELRAAADAALAWLENMSRTTSREQLSRRLRRALGRPEGWKQ